MNKYVLTVAAAAGLFFLSNTMEAEAGGLHVQIGGAPSVYTVGYGGCGGGHFSYYRAPVYRDTSHWDYRAPALRWHGNHFDYIPGGYYWHSTGYWDRRW